MVASPPRVVSLCPSVTETVWALGARLVGRTRYCVHPPELEGRVPVLGGTKNPDLAGILALAPDLVLMNEEENRREDAEELRGAGLAVRSHFPRDVDGALAMVRDLGYLCRAEERAEAIAERIEAERVRVRERAAMRGELPVVYFVWRRPWMVAAGATYIDALLAEAGLRNVHRAAAERYPCLEDGELARGAPGAALLSSEPYPFAAKHLEEVARLCGLERDRVLLVDGEALSWYGLRTPEGLRAADDLAEKLRAAFPPGPAEG